MPFLGTRRSLLGGSPSVADTPWWLSGGVSAANAIAVYQPKGAASLAASYVNLANPGTYNAAPGTAPTFDAGTGWTFDGSTQYLTTGVPMNGSGDFSALLRVSGVSDVGQAFGHGSFGFRPSLNGSLAYYVNGGGVSKAPIVSNGVMAVTDYAYRNGISEGLAQLSTLWSGTFYPHIGASNSVATSATGEANVFFPGSIIALAVYSGLLTAPQVLAISNAMSLL